LFSTALIVFREVVEIALVVSIVMAATKSVARRGLWVAAGLALGIVGACLVAAFTDAIAALAEGLGQEVFNASIMFVAVIMLTWHSVWMGKHGREMAQQMSAVGKAVATGSSSLTGLMLVVGLTVLREGSEVVLFLYGIAAGEAGQYGPMALGAAIGVAGGMLIGAGMYLGLVQISTRRLFSVTNVLITLLAAGMASQGAGFLVDANVLPAFGYEVWDTSSILSDSGILGKMLHTLIGYTAQPSGIQVIVYLLTLVLILGLSRWFGQPVMRGKKPHAQAA
jgi:high-affinity iron transporter